jgi:hypothetical protein
MLSSRPTIPVVPYGADLNSSFNITGSDSTYPSVNLDWSQVQMPQLNTTSTMEDQYVTPPVVDPNQLLELSWSQDTAVAPTIQYLPPQPATPKPVQDPLPQVELPLSNLLKLGLADPSPSDYHQTWRPTIYTDGSEPEWVTERNEVLQDLLDAAAPMFVYGAIIGTPMCQICVDHFAKMRLDIDNTWSKKEIEQKRNMRLGHSQNKV